ncbi:MAG: HD domain-containing protein [Patescibacteria group bacterium]
MKLEYQEVLKNPKVNEFIDQAGRVLKVEGYTEHGRRHCGLVSTRAEKLATEIGLEKHQVELCAIAGYCHDMGNFMGRTEHHYWGALLFGQIYIDIYDIKDVAAVMQAISNHDKDEMKFSSDLSALVVIADKSDISRDRVLVKDKKEISRDIHDRVNYATTKSDLKVDSKKKAIKLILEIDTDFVPIMEYFEIFTERMSYCRKAAQYLGYSFEIEINKIKLL